MYYAIRIGVLLPHMSSKLYFATIMYECLSSLLNGIRQSSIMTFLGCRVFLFLACIGGGNCFLVDSVLSLEPPYLGNFGLDSNWSNIRNFQNSKVWRAQSDDKFRSKSNLSNNFKWSDGSGDSIEVDALANRYDTKHVGKSVLYVPNKEISDLPIVVSAQYGWKGGGDQYGEVYVLCGDCKVGQGNGCVNAPLAVVWIKRSSHEGGDCNHSEIYVYLEGNSDFPLRFDSYISCIFAEADKNVWLGEFQSLNQVDLTITSPGEDQICPDEIYLRALTFLQNKVICKEGIYSKENENKTSLEEAIKVEQPISEVQNDDSIALGWNRNRIGSVVEIAETASVTSQRDDMKKSERLIVTFSNRYETQLTIEGPEKNVDNKLRWSVANGFTLTVQDVDIKDVIIGDALELSADSAVIWTSNVDLSDLSSPVLADSDFELYLDGNVVFRQGNSIVYAQKMYYDLKNRVGIIENAEVLAELPEFEGGFFRLGASKIIQEDENTLRATDAWVSTSMMGKPTYRLQTDSLVTKRNCRPLYDLLTGVPTIDPQTGIQAFEDKRYVIAENNFVSVGNLPIFYWPWMAMDVDDRSLYLKSFKLGHDGILGTQVLTSWDPYQIFSVQNRPYGTEWGVDLDYLTKRGLGHGSTFRYERDSLWNWDTRAVGLINYYGIYDKGFDNLGHGRRNVFFERKYRYRGFWKHRQELNLNSFNSSILDLGSLNEGWNFIAQIGKSSDRNFIPEYFEDEWITSSNPETRFDLKRTVNNRSFEVDVSVRTDSFYTQTNWLPKLEHYWLAQALGETPLVWYEHTKVGYAQFKTTDSPYDEADCDLFRYLDWELDPNSTNNVANTDGTTTISGSGLVFSTRHEVDVPLQLGAIKTTPYALGEYGFWGNGSNADNVSRLYGRLGVRFNLPIWKVDSDVENRTWYVNGLAHKMNVVVDASYSDANKNYSELLLYDQIDDWQIQDFRRRYSTTTFAGSGLSGNDSIPVRFDERYYAIRQGLIAGNVSSPSTELVDDLQMVRIGWNNRWQTKRGPIGNRRVVDWISFDTGINLYPKESENFGKGVGLVDYDVSWQVGDRFSIVSSGLYDVWGTGQKITRIGLQRKRPSLSSCYLGVDRLSGPIDSTYLNFGLTYRTSEKWGIGFSNSYDLSEGYNIGQKLSISRIGESFVMTVGASRNESKDDWGVSLTIEPVFLFDKNKREEGLLGLGNM